MIQELGAMEIREDIPLVTEPYWLLLEPVTQKVGGMSTVDARVEALGCDGGAVSENTIVRNETKYS